MNPLLGDKVGHSRPVCGFGLTPPRCGAPAVGHYAVPLDDETGVVHFPGEPYLIDLEHATLLYACGKHEPTVWALFPIRIGHEVAEHCPHPDSVWADDGCILPTSELTTEVLATEAAPV